MSKIGGAVRAALLWVVFLSSAPVQAAEPGWQRIELGQAGDAYPFAIYSNRPWTGDMSRIESAVIVIHGVSRNGAGYFAAADKLRRERIGHIDDTLVIAPNFFVAADASRQPLEGMPVWAERRGWGAGWNASNWPRPLSSFEVIDDLLQTLSERARFPRLERIALAGHSAGAQLVHRYAALNRIDEKLGGAGIRIRYLVANPSSYLYFTRDRAQASGFKAYDRTLCPGYDRYRHGIENLPPYGAGATGAALFRQYAARDVTYLLGTLDNDPKHPQLDKSCGGLAQGAHRLARGRNYVRYERELAGSQVKLNHRAYEVVGVGHQQSRMFGSKCAARVLFDIPEDTNTTGAPCRAPDWPE